MKKLIFISLIIGSFGATPALAYYHQGYYHQPYPMATPYALNTFYISGDAGVGFLALPEENLPDNPFEYSASYSTSSIAAGGSVGYRRRINPILALGLEGGYDYNGRARYTQTYGIWDTNYFGDDLLVYKITSQDLHALATGTIYLLNGLNVFGKAGVARVHQTLTVKYDYPDSYIPLIYNETGVTGNKPLAAAGIGYSFRNVDIYAQYSHLFGENVGDFSGLFNSDGSMKIVSVDTFKMGLAVGINV